MAQVTSFTITYNLTYGTTVTNPVNSLTVQAVAPWGKSSQRTTVREATEDVINRCGNEQTGRFGLYWNNQTTNSTEVGIP